MASPGLLFLLLVSSSLLFSTGSEVQNQVKAKGEIIRKSIDRIKDMIIPFLGLIPVHGTLIVAVTNLLLRATLDNLKDKEMLDVLKSEFESLNSKMDNYYKMQRWDIWAAAGFHNPEMDIIISWGEFQKIANSLDKEQSEKERLRDHFLTQDCEKIKLATQKLHKYLTNEGVSFIENLGKMLPGHVNCHPKDIRGYTVLIDSLIFKGVTMIQFCYNNQNPKPDVNSEDIKELAKIVYESGSVMFDIHKSCLFNSIEYIKKEVEERIKSTQQRQQLGHAIRSFLAETYDMYDWMVVVFLTKHSSYTRWKSWNKHVLSRFTEVTKNDVTVAIVRQVKGTHTYADKVKRAIKRCFTQTADCHKVGEILENCEESVGSVVGVKVPQSYSAVHAYIDKPHDSHDVKEAPDEVFINPVDNTIPYIYTGDCKKYKVSKNGKFVVLIKSDDDMTVKDPCNKKDCGGDQRGKCVRMEDAFIAVCECKHPYYGENCEKSLEDYKKDLLEPDV